MRTLPVDQHKGFDVQVQSLLNHYSLLDRRDIFVDEVSSGMHHTKRPKLYHLLGQLEAGDTVHIHSIDQLGRSTSDLLNILERIKSCGARLVSVIDDIDTGTGEMADAFLGLLSIMARYERSMISERTKSSLRVLRDRGVELGRPRKVTPLVIEQVQTLHGAAQLSIKEICSTLSISRSSYYRALKLRS